MKDYLFSHLKLINNENIYKYKNKKIIKTGNPLVFSNIIFV